MVPKLTKPGYETEPSYYRICKMTEAQLAIVHNFAISNRWGKVIFHEAVDLRNLDLDMMISFERKSVEIYCDDHSKPQVGEGLNKPATITFYDFGLSKNAEVFDKQLEKIRTWIELTGGEIIRIDTENDTVSIKVDHF